MKIFEATENAEGLAGRPADMKSFWRWMFVLGVVTMLLRGLNIGYVLHASQRDGQEHYAAPDTEFYIQNSVALFDEKPMSPLYRERVAYPFLLAVVKSLGLDYSRLLWLTVPLEIPSVLAMALLGWVLTRRKAVAALAAGIYALNPNGYQLGAVLMPDGLNGQITLMALALLVNWAVNGHRKSAVAACLLLPLSQLIRPTLFLMIVPMLLLFWSSGVRRDRRVLNAALCASVLLYPAANLAINATLYGVPNLLLSSGFQLHVCYVSHVRAAQRNAETPDSMTRLYFDEKHNVALADPREQALDIYGNRPIPPDFATHYNDIVKTSKAFLNKNRWMWFQSGYSGIYHQVFNPPDMAPTPWARHLYPDLPSLMRAMHVLALFFSVCGVMLTIRRFPLGVTLFYAACTGITAMACTGAWYDSVRVRLLADLLYTPILAVGLLSLPAWLCFGGFAVVAYLPRKLFHWSATYMSAASVVSLLASSLFLLRISGPEKQPPGKPD